MTSKGLILTLAAVLVAGTVGAQEPAEDEQARPEPVRKIKVLENPYDIASFYRSRQTENIGFFGYEQSGMYGSERYPIAGYYRQRPAVNQYGYSRFWTTGYGYPAGGRMGAVVFGRRIGQNGDLFLFAPTILAPVGPLTGVFYEGR